MKAAPSSHPSRVLLAVLVLLVPSLLAAPAATGQSEDGWLVAGTSQAEEGWREPNSPYDLPERMWQKANAEAVDRLYLNGLLLSHVVSGWANGRTGDDGIGRNPPVLLQPYAYLGFWRDCNGDGVIGSAVLGSLTYPEAFGFDGSICPPGSAYAPEDGTVYEFLWIGPRATARDLGRTPTGAVSDDGARVWADFGVPAADSSTGGAYAYPLPRGTLSTLGGLVDYADGLTFGRAAYETNRIYGLAGVEGSWRDTVQEVEDSTGVNPWLREAKERYNDSDRDDRHGTPLVRVWDCDGDEDAATPPTRLELEERGSVMPMLDHIAYWSPPEPHEVAEDPTTAARTRECDHAADDDPWIAPYRNLESNRSVAHGDTKTRTDFAMRFLRPAHDAVKPGFHLGLDGTPGLMEGASSSNPRPAIACAMTCTGWYSDELVYLPPGEQASHLLRELHITYYAHVSDMAFSIVGTPRDDSIPGTGMEYGKEFCLDGFGPGHSGRSGWNCNPNAWAERNRACRHCVEVGRLYDVRDVDELDAAGSPVRALLEPPACSREEDNSSGSRVDPGEFQNDDLEAIHPEAHRVLRDCVEETTETVAGTVDDALETLDVEDLLGEMAEPVTEILASPAPVEPSKAVAFVGGARECLRQVPDAGAMVSGEDAPLPDAAEGASGAECLIQQVQTLSELVLDPIKSSLLSLVTGMNVTNATRRVLNDPTALPFDPPSREEVSARVIQRDPVNMGAPTRPIDSLDAHKQEGAPLVPILYGATPYPRFLASMMTAWTSDLLYRSITDVDATAGEDVQLVATVDAGFYNVLTRDERLEDPLILRNIPLGVPIAVNSDRNVSTGFAGTDVPEPEALLGLNVTDADELRGAEFILRADHTTDANFLQAPRVTLHRLTDEPVRALAAAFVQMPNSPYVAALGLDATTGGHGAPEGLPPDAVLQLGANGAVASSAVATSAAPVNIPDVYEFALRLPTEAWPTRPVASYFRVDESDPWKRQVPGDRMDIWFELPKALRSAHATLTVGPDQDGGTLVWEANTATRVRAGMLIERPSGTREAALELTKAPQAFTTALAVAGDRIELNHTATQPIASLLTAWRTTDSANRVREGTLHVQDLPDRVQAALRPNEGRLEVQAADSIGRVAYLGSSRTAETAAPCLAAPGSEYVLRRTTAHGACAVAFMRDLRNLHVTTAPNRTQVRTVRDSDGPRLLVDLEAAKDLRLEASSWPRTIDATFEHTRGRFSAATHASKRVANLSLAYQDAASSLVADVLDAPLHLHLDANATRGVQDLGVTFNASERIGWASVTYTRGPKVGLGADDGVIVVADNGSVQAASVQLRGLRDLHAGVSIEDGVHLVADSVSEAPFHVRWMEEEEWLSAKFPRLPGKLDLDYAERPTGFELAYAASEVIENLTAYVKVGREGGTFNASLTNLPKWVNLTVDAEGHVKAAASSELKDFELALTGPDHAVPDVAWANYVSIDRGNPLRIGDVEAPRFHVRLQGFRNVSASFSRMGEIHAFSNFTDAAPFALRYNGTDGWATLNVSSLPPFASFRLSGDGLAWNATPGHVIELAEGAAKRTDWEGRFRLEDVPDQVTVNWGDAGGRFTVDLNHSGTLLGRVDFDGILPSGSPPEDPSKPASKARVRLHAVDIPPSVHAIADSLSGSFHLQAKTRTGDPHTLRNVSLGYAQDASDPLFESTEGLVHARFSGGVPVRVQVALPTVRLVDARVPILSAEPDEGSRTSPYHLRYEGEGGFPVRVGVSQGEASRVHGRLAELPANLTTRLRYDADSHHFTLDHTADAAVPDLFLRLEDPEREIEFSGHLPLNVHARHETDRVTFHASEPMTAHLVMRPIGSSLDIPVDRNGIRVRMGEEDTMPLAMRVTGLKSLHADWALHDYRVDRAFGGDLDLDLGLPGGDRVVVVSEAAPASFSLRFDPRLTHRGIGDLDWQASGTTDRLNLSAELGDRFLNVGAESLPPEVEAALDLTTGRVDVSTRQTGAIGTLQVGYSADGTRQAPRLADPGLAVIATLANKHEDDASEVHRISARVDGLETLHADWSERMNLHLERDRGGDTFTARVRTDARGFDLRANDVPRELTASYESSGNAGGGKIHLDGHGDRIGNLTGKYVGVGTERFNLAAHNLPTMVNVELTGHAGNGFHAFYGSGGTPYEATGLDLELTTPDGYVLDGSLHRVPQQFDVYLEPGRGRAEYQSLNGSLSGELVVARIGTPVVRVPATHHGASIRVGDDTLSGHFRVDGLQSFEWQQNARRQGGRDFVHVKHAQPLDDKPAFLRFENGTSVGTLRIDPERGLVSIPSGLNVTLLRTENRTHVNLTANETIGHTRVDAWQKKEGAGDLHANVTAIPAWVEFDLRRLPQNDGAPRHSTQPWEATLRRATVTGFTPAADVTLRLSDGKLVTGHVSHLPEHATLLVNPGATAADPCLFRFNASEPIPLLDVDLGEGHVQRGGWVRNGDHWIHYDNTTSGKPTLGLRIAGAKEASHCRTPDGFRSGAETGGSDDLRVLVKVGDKRVRGQVSGLPGGPYFLEKSAGNVSLGMPDRVGGVNLDTTLNDENFVSFDLRAEGVPKWVNYTHRFVGGREMIEVHSNGERLDHFEMTAMLTRRDEFSRGSTRADSPSWPVAFEARDFAADRLIVKVSESGVIDWTGGDAKHQVVISRDQRGMQLGIDFKEFGGGALMQERINGKISTELLDIRLAPQGRTWIDIDLGTRVEISLHPTPEVLHFQTREGLARLFETTVTPSTPLERLTYRVTGAAGGVAATLEDVPGGEPTNIGLKTGPAFVVDIASTALLTAHAVSLLGDSRARLAVEGVKDFIMQADLDGATQYSDRPRFLTFDGYATRADVDIRFGKESFWFAAGNLATDPAAVLKWQVKKATRAAQERAAEAGEEIKATARWIGTKIPTNLIGPTMGVRSDGIKYVAPPSFWGQGKEA